MGLRIDGCNCTTLRRASRRVSQFYDGKLAAIGLKATQFGILAVLGEVGEASIGELAAHLDMDRTTTGKNLRPLERRGLIASKPAPGDERSRRVSLTKEGVEALTTGRPLWLQAHQQFEALNGPETAAALRTLLHGLKI
jgi:DNA-binding MarR family transcriptional regulator